MKKKILTTNTKAAAAKPFELVEPGPTTPRVLKTSDLPGGSRMSEIDDKGFIGLNATPEELRDLRTRIEARQVTVAAAPDQPETILICDNVGCRRWDSYDAKRAARNLGQSCLFCNARNLSGGGRLRAASETETALFWSLKAKREALFKQRVREQMEAERQRRAMGIHLMLDNKQGPSIQDDPSIKRNR